MSRLSEPQVSKRVRTLSLIALGAVLLASLAIVAAQTAGTPPPTDSSQAPVPAEPKKAHEAEEKELKVVRWVCTDHLCGGCDGACSRSGHVAVSRKGHCACTPKAGGKLDEAIRKAFEPHLKSRGGE
jgi:hypothetical protein